MAIFKYLTEESHADAMINRGNILFRPLSYYKALENDAARGDPDDGALRYAPAAGLQANLEGGGMLDLTGHLLRSSPKCHDIFVSCMSRQFSPEIGAVFGARFCVEISGPEPIVRRLRARAQIQSRIDYAKTIFGDIVYRPLGEPPIVDWALPERLVFIKPDIFASQNECRFVLGKRGALDAHNVDLLVHPIADVPQPVKSSNEKLILQVDSLAEFASLHRF